MWINVFPNSCAFDDEFLDNNILGIDSLFIVDDSECFKRDKERTSVFEFIGTATFKSRIRVVDQLIKQSRGN